MKLNKFIITGLVLSMVPLAAQENFQSLSTVVAQNRTSRARPSSGGGRNELRDALNLVKTGQLADASARLFQLSLSPKYVNQRMQIRYLLGLTLYQMKLYQLAAFQFISVIRDGKSRYVSSSLEKLSLAANELGDETLLNYAISRVRTEKFPAVHKDMLYYRIGEFQIRNEQYGEAVRSLAQVGQQSSLHDKAMYMTGLAHALAGRAEQAADTFEVLLDKKSSAPVTDQARVAALMGKARALYQKKDWDGAIQAYRDVPRDSTFWHDTLFESTWALLRSGRFRSAISNFQSLHSPYYEETYLPESLLLRSIVYLYICQFDEMEKVLNLFKKIYVPVYKQMLQYLKTNNNAVQYFNDVVTTLRAAEKGNFDPSKAKLAIPYIITKKVFQEGDFQRSFEYIKNLVEERRRIRKLPATWRTGAIGKYAERTIERRMQRARAKAGRQVRSHMLSVRVELLDLFEQEGFIRFEMNNSKREQLKKMSAGKVLPKVQVDEDRTRDYYVQNGYQYWPFQGEYWLDELGNYHYVGTQSCQ